MFPEIINFQKRVNFTTKTSEKDTNTSEKDTKEDEINSSKNCYDEGGNSCGSKSQKREK